MPEYQVVPARKGKAVRLMAGQTIKIINQSGTQVVDTWAFPTLGMNEDGIGEHLSMPHCRVASGHLRPRVGDTLVSNGRVAMLTVEEDTSGGVHDTLMAACDPMRYRLSGVKKWKEHANCAENLVLGLRDWNDEEGNSGDNRIGGNITMATVPAPLNLFMNIPWDQEGNLKFSAPECKKGGFVTLRAKMDLLLVMSACPQDVSGVNGETINDAHFVVR